jgi:ABC-type branched-subunit amino acid transport system ATPase component
VSAVIQVRDVSVQFGGVKALDHVSFQREGGAATAIVGPNGAGKSTLLNAINGVVRPSTGSVELLGARVDGWRPYKVARAGVHRSFQHPHLLETRSVLENVMVGGHVERKHLWFGDAVRPRRAARTEVELRDRCLDLLGAAHLGSVARTKTGSLPYGMKKLVDIVRAFVGHPPVVLLDEPSSGMGEEDRESLIELLRRIRQDLGTTLLIVEHHMDVVRGVADTVLALTQGRVVLDSPVAEVGDLENVGLVPDEVQLPVAVGESHRAGSPS